VDNPTTISLHSLKNMYYSTSQNREMAQTITSYNVNWQTTHSVPKLLPKKEAADKTDVCVTVKVKLILELSFYARIIRMTTLKSA
jgi:hypothetical protein